MPHYTKDNLNDYAVLWLRSEVGSESFDADGEPIVADPIEISCRWENRVSQIVGDEGDAVAIDAQVAVAQHIPEGSQMWEGRLSSWTGTGSSLEVDETDVMIVVGVETVEDFKGRNPRRVLYLRRFRDSATN